MLDCTNKKAKKSQCPNKIESGQQILTTNYYRKNRQNRMRRIITENQSFYQSHNSTFHSCSPKNSRQKQKISPLIKYDSNFLLVNPQRIRRYKTSDKVSLGQKNMENLRQSKEYSASQQEKFQSLNQTSNQWNQPKKLRIQIQQHWPISLSKYMESKQKMYDHLFRAKNAKNYFEYQKLSKMNEIRQKKRMKSEITENINKAKMSVNVPINWINDNKSYPTDFVSNLLPHTQANKCSKLQNLLKKVEQQNSQIDNNNVNAKQMIKKHRNEILLGNFVNNYFKKKYKPKTNKRIYSNIIKTQEQCDYQRSILNNTTLRKRHKTNYSGTLS